MPAQSVSLCWIYAAAAAVWLFIIRVTNQRNGNAEKLKSPNNMSASATLGNKSGKMNVCKIVSIFLSTLMFHLQGLSSEKLCLTGFTQYV